MRLNREGLLRWWLGIYVRVYIKAGSSNKYPKINSKPIRVLILIFKPSHILIDYAKRIVLEFRTSQILKNTTQTSISSYCEFYIPSGIEFIAKLCNVHGWHILSHSIVIRMELDMCKYMIKEKGFEEWFVGSSIHKKICWGVLFIFWVTKQHC